MSVGMWFLPRNLFTLKWRDQIRQKFLLTICMVAHFSGKFILINSL